MYDTIQVHYNKCQI